VVVDLEAVARLPRPVTLAEIKALPAFATSPLVRQGRLSVVPLTKVQWDLLIRAAGGKP
jgi:predicted RNA-binding protein with PUA-like domain